MMFFYNKDKLKEKLIFCRTTNVKTLIEKRYYKRCTPHKNVTKHVHKQTIF